MGLYSGQNASEAYQQQQDIATGVNKYVLISIQKQFDFKLIWYKLI